MACSGLQWPLGPLWALKTAQIRGFQDQVGIPHFFIFELSLRVVEKKSGYPKIDFQKSPSKKARSPPCSIVYLLFSLTSGSPQKKAMTPPCSTFFPLFFPVGFAAVSSQGLTHHKCALAEASKQPITNTQKIVQNPQIL